MWLVPEILRLSCFCYCLFLKAKAAQEVRKDGILLPVKHGFQVKHLLVTYCRYEKSQAQEPSDTLEVSQGEHQNCTHDGGGSIQRQAAFMPKMQMLRGTNTTRDAAGLVGCR